MTEDDFRALALALPETEERSHMGHPDFRVSGKIFATLRSPKDGFGMVKLTPDEQEVFVKLAPDAFMPVKGKWGERGCTNVNLRAARKSITGDALLAAWRTIAPKRLRDQAKR